jgi:hypothetical protein
MRRRKKMRPTQEQITEHFDYIGGALIRKTTGKRGYTRPDGYVYVRLLGRSFGEHRLVHLLFSGEWPYQVDHVNGVRNDNRPENLRSASHAQNCMNRKPMGTSSKGCYWQPKHQRWIAQIGVSGKRKTIGYYSTESEAAAAYANAAAELHGEFMRVS